MCHLPVHDRDPASAEQDVREGRALVGVARGPHRGRGEQRGDAEAVAEGQVAAEERAQHAGQLFEVPQASAEVVGDELGGQAVLGQERLGGAWCLAGVVGPDQGEVSVRVGRVEGVAERGLQPGGALGFGCAGGALGFGCGSGVFGFGGGCAGGVFGCGCGGGAARGGGLPRRPGGRVEGGGHRTRTASEAWRTACSSRRRLGPADLVARPPGGVLVQCGVVVEQHVVPHGDVEA
ncbi:hypothetical protein R2F25_37975 [Streptomyces sp. UP1A-1]|nr:hypothetical protein [Streptomyces sp. UP1A-1]